MWHSYPTVSHEFKAVRRKKLIKLRQIGNMLNVSRKRKRLTKAPDLFRCKPADASSTAGLSKDSGLYCSKFWKSILEEARPKVDLRRLFIIRAILVYWYLIRGMQSCQQPNYFTDGTGKKRGKQQMKRNYRKSRSMVTKLPASWYGAHTNLVNGTDNQAAQPSQCIW